MNSDFIRCCCPGLRPGLAVFALSSVLVTATAEAGEFYLRSGAGFDDIPGDSVFLDKDCDSRGALPLYGCGRDADGNPRRSIGQFDSMAVMEFGAGYDPEGAARFELLVEYRPGFRYDGKPNFDWATQQDTVADARSISAMAAAFFDMNATTLPVVGQVGPFVGAGIGVARNTVKNKTQNFPRTYTTVPDGSHTDTAWMVTAGFSIELDDRTNFDIGWRYTDLGEFRTGTGGGQVVWRDGSMPPDPLDLAPTWTRLRAHGLRLSIRRSF